MPKVARHGAAHPLALPAIALAAALWAGAAVLAADLFAAGVTALELAEGRAVVATVGFALIPAAWVAPASSGRRAPVLVGLGLAIALVNATYYVAIERLPVAIAIVLQYTAPVLVVASTAVVSRRVPTPAVGGSLVAALVGVVLVTGALGGDVPGLDPLGVVMGLGAAAFFATYTMLGERARRDLAALGVMLRGFGVASAFWIAVQVPSGWPHALVAPDNLPRVLLVGIGGTLAPFLLYVWAVAHVRAERAAIAATLEPVLAALAAWVWLEQSLGPAQLAGGGLVIAAVLWLQLARASGVRHPEP